MRIFLICIFFAAGVLASQGVPVPQQERGYYSAGSDSSGSGGTPCQSQETSPGVFRVDCRGNPGTIRREHILWLKPSDGSAQSLDVVVPNYNIEELIKAAVKAGGREGSTSINILLKKPQTTYDVQAQDAQSQGSSKPQVSIQYEAVPAPISQHYPTDKQYNPSTGPILEPGQGRPTATSAGYQYS